MAACVQEAGLQCSAECRCTVVWPLCSAMPGWTSKGTWTVLTPPPAAALPLSQLYSTNRKDYNRRVRRIAQKSVDV